MDPGEWCRFLGVKKIPPKFLPAWGFHYRRQISPWKKWSNISSDGLEGLFMVGNWAMPSAQMEGKLKIPFLTHYGSMGMVYLPTWIGWFFMVNVGKCTNPMYGSEFVEFLMNFAQIWENCTTQVLKETNIEMNVRNVRWCCPKMHEKIAKPFQCFFRLVNFYLWHKKM